MCHNRVVPLDLVDFLALKSASCPMSLTTTRVLAHETDVTFPGIRTAHLLVVAFNREDRSTFISHNWDKAQSSTLSHSCRPVDNKAILQYSANFLGPDNLSAPSSRHLPAQRLCETIRAQCDSSSISHSPRNASNSDRSACSCFEQHSKAVTPC